MYEKRLKNLIKAHESCTATWAKDMWLAKIEQLVMLGERSDEEIHDGRRGRGTCTKALSTKEDIC